MTIWRTSEAHPLQIASVSVPGTRGVVGITFCPGKTDKAAASGSWRRSLGVDIAAIRHWGAEAVVTLIEKHEFTLLKVDDLGMAVSAAGLTWVHMPIVDVSIPDHSFELCWAEKGPGLREILRRGGRIVVHCRGGLGRAGTVAARLLVEFGMASNDAIAAVRSQRPGAIETKA